MLEPNWLSKFVSHKCAHFKKLFACRLIPLDKCPGVRPIGIGKVLWCIIEKCVMKTLKVDVEESVGNIQTCDGQQAGIEASIHAMQEVYNKNESEALLLVDATNAFNSLNRQVALRNVKILCPNIAQQIKNTYKQLHVCTLLEEMENLYYQKKEPNREITVQWHFTPSVQYPS